MLMICIRRNLKMVKYRLIEDGVGEIVLITDKMEMAVIRDPFDGERTATVDYYDRPLDKDDFDTWGKSVDSNNGIQGVFEYASDRINVSYEDYFSDRVETYNDYLCVMNTMKWLGYDYSDKYERDDTICMDVFNKKGESVWRL